MRPPRTNLQAVLRKYGKAAVKSLSTLRLAPHVLLKVAMKLNIYPGTVLLAVSLGVAVSLLAILAGDAKIDIGGGVGGADGTAIGQTVDKDSTRGVIGGGAVTRGTAPHRDRILSIGSMAIGVRAIRAGAKAGRRDLLIVLVKGQHDAKC